LIRLETEAKLQIQHLILEKKINLIWSFILHYENKDNPYKYKKERIALWEFIAKDHVSCNDEIQDMAKDLLAKGMRAKDALHIACALYAKAQFFITTDKKLQANDVPGLGIVSPIVFLEGYYHEI